MQRSRMPEVMDDPSVPDGVWVRFHRDLSRLDRLLGNHQTIIRTLQADHNPISTVLDIGCGSGELLRAVRDKLHVKVRGVDLRGPRTPQDDLEILQADAVREPLPEADVAVSVYVIHHLGERQIVDLIRNVGRSSRRLILLDLVRHWLPLILYRVFLYPMFDPVVASDGCQSIRRAYTPKELRTLVEEALQGSGASFSHKVSPWRSNQLVDIRWS
jgi:SAM-dependent methyltransferase